MKLLIGFIAIAKLLMYIIVIMPSSFLPILLVASCWILNFLQLLSSWFSDNLFITLITSSFMSIMKLLNPKLGWLFQIYIVLWSFWILPNNHAFPPLMQISIRTEIKIWSTYWLPLIGLAAAIRFLLCSENWLKSVLLLPFITKGSVIKVLMLLRSS